VALVAVVEEDGRPVVGGGARYIVVQSRKAEVAFALVDAYQGRGIGRALLHHLAAIAGLEELIAEILPDNIPMLKVLEKSGFPMRAKREAQVVHVSLRLR
jgi:RimJ/RimL family protein N-acetyltransferase